MKVWIDILGLLILLKSITKTTVLLRFTVSKCLHSQSKPFPAEKRLSASKFSSSVLKFHGLPQKILTRENLQEEKTRLILFVIPTLILLCSKFYANINFFQVLACLTYSIISPYASSLDLP